MQSVVMDCHHYCVRNLIREPAESSCSQTVSIKQEDELSEVIIEKEAHTSPIGTELKNQSQIASHEAHVPILYGNLLMNHKSDCLKMYICDHSIMHTLKNLKNLINHCELKGMATPYLYLWKGIGRFAWQLEEIDSSLQFGDISCGFEKACFAIPTNLASHIDALSTTQLNLHVGKLQCLQASSKSTPSLTLRDRGSNVLITMIAHDPMEIKCYTEWCLYGPTLLDAVKYAKEVRFFDGSPSRKCNAGDLNQLPSSVCGEDSLRCHGRYGEDVLGGCSAPNNGEDFLFQDHEIQVTDFKLDKLKEEVETDIENVSSEDVKNERLSQNDCTTTNIGKSSPSLGVVLIPPRTVVSNGLSLLVECPKCMTNFGGRRNRFVCLMKHIHKCHPKSADCLLAYVKKRYRSFVGHF